MMARLGEIKAVRVTQLDADGVPIPGTSTTFTGALSVEMWTPDNSCISAGLPPSQENPMNTHAAFLSGEEGSKDERIAGGTEQWCAQVLAARLLIAPGRTGYVRPLTEAELK